MSSKVKLTDKEQKTVDALVRLGDSEELAIKTVIKDRKKNSYSTEMYEQAYYS